MKVPSLKRLVNESTIWWNVCLMRHFNPALTLWPMAWNRFFWTQYHKSDTGHRFYDWWIFRIHIKPKKAKNARQSNMAS